MTAPAWAAPQATGGEAAVITIDGPIGPATSHYVSEALQKAETRHARVVVLKLDTPGGLASSMRDIIKAILASRIPVIGYVAPSGARAASAGTYILYATHIAAMAPTTNLGAATPVPVMGEEKASSEMTAEQRKVLNDSVAYIQALAAKRGRNAQWAEKAVREAASLPAEAALKKNVIDLIAPSTAALLNRVDGRQVEIDGKPVVLQTRGLTLHEIQPDWRTKFLAVVTNPTLAYLLFLAGILGIVIEATHPGLVFPGVVGAICLLFALFAFQILPVNYAGIALIILGIGLMVAEAFVTSFGSLGIGGVAAFVIGSILLMDTQAPGFTIRLSVIVGVSATISICLLLLIVFAVRAHKRAVVSGAEELVGAIALPVAAFSGVGQVRVHGEIWRARAPGTVEEGQPVKIVRMDGLTLDVQPLESPLPPGGEG
ncbi:MAG TPA: nodulation protein NfeD [Gammaproteobacteria bacterium]|nr:nodulation protein NfeD [Gammaproteobacteria bacterium]